MFRLFKAKEQASPQKQQKVFVLNHEDPEDDRTLELCMDVENYFHRRLTNHMAIIHLISTEMQ